jgi:hypothetical protein
MALITCESVGWPGQKGDLPGYPVSLKYMDYAVKKIG